VKEDILYKEEMEGLETETCVDIAAPGSKKEDAGWIAVSVEIFSGGSDRKEEGDGGSEL